MPVPDAPEIAPPVETPAPESNRRVFPYWDGERTRFADPLAVQRKLYRTARPLGGLAALWDAAFPAPDAFAPTPAPAADDPAAPALTAHEASEAERLQLLADAAEDARARLAAVAADAFGASMLDPETGKGLTEDEAIAVVTSFNAWLEKKEPAPAT